MTDPYKDRIDFLGLHISSSRNRGGSRARSGSSGISAWWNRDPSNDLASRRVNDDLHGGEIDVV